MLGGYYLEKYAGIGQVIKQAFLALPMVLWRLWPLIIAVLLCQVGSGFFSVKIMHYSSNVYVMFAYALFMFVLQAYLWSTILVACNHLLAKFTAFSLASCLQVVNAHIFKVLFISLLGAIWVLYMPHIFIGFFMACLKMLGVQGNAMVLGGVLLGTLLVFSGIVSFIFTIPLILFENLKVTRALSRSGELVSPFWGYVVGIYIFCVLTYILTSAHTVLFQHLFGAVLAQVVSGVFNFVLYPLYLLLFLHLLRYILSTKNPPVKKRPKLPKLRGY